MSENNNHRDTGVTFWGLLGILFIGLKLTGYIDWSWWWVLAPLWGPLVFILCVIVPIALVVILVNDRDLRRANERRKIRGF